MKRASKVPCRIIAELPDVGRLKNDQCRWNEVEPGSDNYAAWGKEQRLTDEDFWNLFAHPFK